MKIREMRTGLIATEDIGYPEGTVATQGYEVLSISDQSLNLLECRPALGKATAGGKGNSKK